MFEKTNPSIPLTMPWKPSSSVDFAIEQTNDWNRASACVSSTEVPPPRSDSGSMPAAWTSSAGAHTREAAKTRPPGRPAFHRAATAPRGWLTRSRHCSRISSGVMVCLHRFQEAVQEQGADLARERPRIVPGAQEGAGGDAVQHAEQQVRRREEFVARAPARVELAQDREPAPEVLAPLGGDLGASGLLEQLPVPVDDLEVCGAAEAEVEVRLDQRQELHLGRPRLGERVVEGCDQCVESPIEHQEEQLILAADVVVEPGERQTSGSRDLPNRRMGIPAPGDAGACGLDDAPVAVFDRHPNLLPNDRSVGRYSRLFGQPWESVKRLIYLGRSTGNEGCGGPVEAPIFSSHEGRDRRDLDQARPDLAHARDLAGDRLGRGERGGGLGRGEPP